MSDPLWYQDAVFYEVHVRAFQDGNDDGIGDFVGLTRRLDYLKDLGVDCIWLLPFFPSPLRDDGYDVADYRTVHPDYGTLADFERFLEEAHARGLRVISDLVVNHTSDQHRWVQEARRRPAGPRGDPHIQPAPLVPGGPPRSRLALPPLLRMERQRPALPGRAHHLP